MKLTREKILKEPAGRQLDTWVAEYVMGWVFTWPVSGYHGNKDGELPPPKDEIIWCGWPTVKDKESNNIVIIPLFSTDIAAAWEALEVLIKGGACPSLIFDDNKHWALSLEGMQNVPESDNPIDIWTSFFIEKDYWCDSAPLAICRAALLAVLEEDNG